TSSPLVSSSVGTDTGPLSVPREVDGGGAGVCGGSRSGRVNWASSPRAMAVAEGDGVGRGAGAGPVAGIVTDEERAGGARDGPGGVAGGIRGASVARPGGPPACAGTPPGAGTVALEGGGVKVPSGGAVGGWKVG